MEVLMPKNKIAALAVIAAWLSVPLAAAATCTTKSLNPDLTVCLPTMTAGSSFSASGSSDANVRFTVTDFTGGVLLTILNQGSSRGFSQTWDISSNPEFFAGNFTVCAHRGSNHTTPANVTICGSGF
jgi:hypothetical protein